MSPGRIRGAQGLLENAFLTRTIAPTRLKHRATEKGLRRKPVMFTFGARSKRPMRGLWRSVRPVRASAGRQRPFGPRTRLGATVAGGSAKPGRSPRQPEAPTAGRRLQIRE